MNRTVRTLVMGLGTFALAQAAFAAPSSTPDTPFIIGGTEVQPSDLIASTTVALVASTPAGTALCTGSLIAKDMIVTAAHCVDGIDPQSIKIVFGTSIFTSKQKVTARATAEPSDYGSTGVDTDKDQDDIGLVAFDGGLPDGYSAAQLLDSQEQLHDGEAVTLAGYGITTGTPDPNDNAGAGVLRKVDVTIAQASWGKTEVAMDQTQGTGACHGDSGGPAFVKSGGQYYLFGVTSRGPADLPDDCASKGIYTNILAHLDWIKLAEQKLRSSQ